MTFKLKLLRGRKGKEKGGQCSIKVRATFFSGMRLQRWSKKKKVITEENGTVQLRRDRGLNMSAVPLQTAGVRM